MLVISTRNDKGPNIEPGGYLHIESARAKLNPLIDANRFLLVRYDANHLLEIPLMQ